MGKISNNRKYKSNTYGKRKIQGIGNKRLVLLLEKKIYCAYT